MFGSSGYGPYPTYNPMTATQQRLAQMEAQYPQFAPGGVNTYSPVSGPLAAPQGPQTGFIRGRVVTSIDEVKGAIIDLDGGVHVFTDFGNHKIYTKQINLDGTATINTYILENPGRNPSPVYQEDLDRVVKSLTEEINDLRNKIGGIKYAQPNVNDGDAQRKK